MAKSGIKSQRNGKIEFYRFVFSIYVLLMHTAMYIIEPEYTDEDIISFFARGAMGVEFFFLVSGYLMAQTVYKIRLANPEKANTFEAIEGLRFLRKKYFSILPQHLVVFPLTFIAYALVKDFTIIETIKKAIDSVPGLFLMQSTGLTYTTPNHVTWYISSMLIAMAVIYPVLRKHYTNFTKYIAPVGAILIVGYIMHETKRLTGVFTWMGIGFKGVLRAIVEISLGTSAFELSRFLAEKEFTKKQKLLLTMGEVGCFVLVTMYVLSRLSNKYEVYALALLFVMVSLCFSGQTLDLKLYNNKLSFFLGKISLPIYLSQLSAVYLVNNFMPDNSTLVRVLATVGLTFGIGLVVMVIGEKFSKLLFVKKKS